MEKLYRVSEVIKLLSISRTKLYALIKDWKITTKKVFGQIRIPQSSVEEAIENNDQ